MNLLLLLWLLLILLLLRLKLPREYLLRFKMLLLLRWKTSNGERQLGLGGGI